MSIKNFPLFIKLKEHIEEIPDGYGESNIFVTDNPYEAKRKILSTNRGLRILIQKNIPLYLIGDMYHTTHIDMIEQINNYGYDIDYDSYDDDQICLLYNPYPNNENFIEDNAICDDYYTRYMYNRFDIWSELDKDFTQFELSEILGEIEDIIDYSEYYQEEDSEILNEQLLLELNRGQLINKSKKSDNYKDQSKGKNRWDRRTKSRIDTQVAQYNKINMNDFFKDDELKVGINVHGETNDYTVLIRYRGVLRELQEQVKRNNNKLEFKCVLIALQRIFNSENVFVSCTCPDFRFRQAYYATKDGYNSGIPEIRPSDITNPNDTKGAGCKHINLILGNVDWIMKVASVINNYIHYMEEHMQRKYADLMFPKIYGIPYNKAVQLNLFDQDNELYSSEEDIKLSNKYGRDRTKFRSDVRINNMKNFKGKEPFKTDPDTPKLDLNMTRKMDEIKNNLSDKEDNIETEKL